MTSSRTTTNAIIIGIFAAICIAGMQFLALNIGQQNPLATAYTVNAVFSDADGIPTAADVRVAGVDVGKVVQVSHDPQAPGETVVTLQITDPKAVPVYTNGYAMVRPKTLLGEKYIDLTIGSSLTGDSIASGGFLPLSQASSGVENDQIFDAFDSQTRAEQQQVLAELDQATFSRSGDIQQIIPQLTTVVGNLQPLADVYEKDQPQVDDIFVQLNVILQTLADEHVQVAGLLSNGNVALGAIAQKDQALITTMQAAAAFSNEFNNALAPTVNAQRQAIQELSPALESQIALLDETIGPQSVCGGKACGIDQVFTGTLLGNINYPNDQLTVTTAPGELVTDEWDALFSQPTNDHRGLSFVESGHGNTPICPPDC